MKWALVATFGVISAVSCTTRDADHMGGIDRVMDDD